MDKIKKVSIVTGAVVGGVLGGAVSMVGTLAHNKFLDRLGEDIVDSTILTAGIAGDALSGTANLAAGAIKRDKAYLSEAKHDFSQVGHRVFDNFKTNVKLIWDNSGEILLGIKTRDGRRILNGAKTLGKIAAISTITVGAVQINLDEDRAPDTEQKKNSIEPGLTKNRFSLRRKPKKLSKES